MSQASPKYSIIVPSKNGSKYLPCCIDTITSQEYSDYELIISDDHSTDGTKEYLSTLSIHTNIKVIEPPEFLSMTEHWEWALSHAKGDWLIFVGQDDGLQPYFFELADKLTVIAEQKHLRTIMSQRAYYFWPGCNLLYGDVAVNYYATNKVTVLNSKLQALKALLGIQEYFELPEMYTTSMFHKSILEEARLLQEGNVLTCHPQDANLGVVACSLDNYYLKSFIPLGWVGTSPKSAGMAISTSGGVYNQTQEMKTLELEYKEKIEKSKLSYHELAGSFSFGDAPLYFWQAFLKTPLLRTKCANNFLVSRFFKTIFFSALGARLILKNANKDKFNEFKKILNGNKLSNFYILSLGVILFCIVKIFMVINIIPRVFRKVLRHTIEDNIIIYLKWKGSSSLSLREVCNRVQKKYVEFTLNS